MNDNDANVQEEISMMDGLVQLSFLVQGVLNRIGAEYELSIIQIRLFGILRDRELTMLQLAQYLGLDKSSITGLISRAERRGLVERRSSRSDRRVIHVKVTPEGHQLIRVVSGEIERHVRTITDKLNDAERASFMALASKLIRD
ncbi:MarR family winged helix-turn-helix transcriptional regulator [Cohnella fermenti]|uniref:MarR family transcriptional regulator n=1 Tax=Cohnella fermenti TaxID=2565925 RepID=A0A4S4BNH1_9BACL|nr:MarR family transcriptional regulator [Cohnella fermenti]THF76411.1 MarR family transcriptional regulator [Cohnella fermenti]